MMGLFGTVESNVFVPSIIAESFAEVGLWPWSPTLIRRLCQIHCPPPSLHKKTDGLKKLESIMKEMLAELQQERDKLITIGKCVRDSSSENGERYFFRERKGRGSQVCEK